MNLPNAVVEVSAKGLEKIILGKGKAYPLISKLVLKTADNAPGIVCRVIVYN